MKTVGIIGTGKIAQKYSSPGNEQPYCHVGGIHYSDKVELAAVADIDPDALADFRERWGEQFPNIREYDSGEAMLAAESDLDIVGICVRGPDHFEVTSQAVEARPRAIFLEKPPTCSLEQMDRLTAAADQAGVPITVSYTRHWAPHVLKLAELVGDGLIGEVQRVVGFCANTFLSFAAHTTDLICQFAGYDAKAVYARGRTVKEGAPGYEPEPDVESMIIEYESGVIGTHVGAGSARGAMYVEITGSEGSARVGMYIPAEAVRGKNEQIDLGELGVPEPGSIPGGPFRVAYNRIADAIDGGADPGCTNGDWHTVNEIGFAGIESFHTDRRIELPNTNRTRLIWANG